MLLEDKFLYALVLETDGHVATELTFAGATLMLIGMLIAVVAVGFALFAVLTYLGIRV